MKRRFSLWSLAIALVIASAIFAPGMSPPVYTDKITGPASSTDNAIVRYDGTTGKLAQDSPYSTIADDGTAVFDTSSRIVDTLLFTMSNNSVPLFGVLAASGFGAIANLVGDATDKDAFYLATPVDATGAAGALYGIIGTGAITIELDMGANAAKIENTYPAPLLIDNQGGLIQVESARNILLDMPDAAGVRKVSFRDSTDTQVATVDSNGNIVKDGALFLNPTTQTTTPYLATANDDVILMNVAGVSVVNLPTAAGINGRVYIIKRLSGVGANTVTIIPNGIETIDGVASKSLFTVNESLRIMSDGTNWLVI